MHRVHTAVRSVSDDITKRNPVTLEVELRRGREEAVTHALLEEQHEIGQILATGMREAKDLLKDEIQIDLEYEMRQALSEELKAAIEERIQREL